MGGERGNHIIEADVPHPASGAGTLARSDGRHRMSTATLAGILLIVLPLAFNAAFGLLGARFDYPDILRRPTDEVLTRFREGGTALVLLWWAFALSAVLFAPLVVLLAEASTGADGTLLAVGSTIGVLAAIVQFLASSGGRSSSPTWPGSPPTRTRARRAAMPSTSSFSRSTGTSASPWASTSATR